MLNLHTRGMYGTSSSSWPSSSLIGLKKVLIVIMIIIIPARLDEGGDGEGWILDHGWSGCKILLYMKLHNHDHHHHPGPIGRRWDRLMSSFARVASESWSWKEIRKLPSKCWQNSILSSYKALVKGAEKEYENYKYWILREWWLSADLSSDD